MARKPDSHQRRKELLRGVPAYLRVLTSYVITSLPSTDLK